MVDRLEHFGPEIEFVINVEDVPEQASERPLFLFGIAKQISDIYDSAGALNTAARLTGPAMLESALQTTANWLLTKVAPNNTITLVVKGVTKIVTVPPGSAIITGAVALATYLTTAFAADGTFGGVTVSAILDTATSNYKLRFSTIQTGDTATLKADTTTAATFGLGAVDGVTYYGFGSYQGYDMAIPFLAFPDPHSVIDTCVLDDDFADSISIGAYIAGVGMRYLSQTAAYERSAYQRPVTRTLNNGAGIVKVVNASPFIRKAAADYPPVLVPWTPAGTSATKFWIPGVNPTAMIPSADGLVHATIALTEVATPENSAELSMFHGSVLSQQDLAGATGLHGVNVVTAGGGPASVVYVASVDGVSAGTLTITAVPAGPTFAEVKAVLEGATGNVYVGLFSMTIVGLGATVCPLGAVGFFTGGLAPVTFDLAKDVCTLYGNVLYTAAGNTTAAIELHLAIDGSHLVEFNWPATTPYATILSDINAQFPAAFSSQAVGGGKAVAKLVSTGKGREGSIYIAKCTNIDQLFLKASQTYADAEYNCEATLTIITLVAPATGLVVLPGDTITQGALSATVARVVDSGANVALYLNVPTAFLFGVADTITITSHLTAADYVCKHHGLFWPTTAGDELWMNGSRQAQVASLVAIANDDTPPVAFGNAGLQLSEVFGITDTFTNWYLRVTDITSAGYTGGTMPHPEMIMVSDEQYLSIRNEAVVDNNGNSYTGVQLPLYAGYEAIRTDISAEHLQRALSVMEPSDLTPYTPIDPRNELIFGAWGVMQVIRSTGVKKPFYILGVASNELPDWQAVQDVIEKERVWMPIALTANEQVNTWLANYVKGSMTSTRKKDWRTFLAVDIPEESAPEALGTATAGASNVTPTQFVIDLGELNVGAVLMSHTPIAYDPGAITTATGLFVMISGGGASDADEGKRWLVSSVVSGTNTVVVTHAFTPGDGLNDDGYYADEDPPAVTNATLTLYQRGSAITTPDEKLDALQTYAKTIVCHKVELCPSGNVTVSDYNGQLISVPNYFGSAALAAVMQTHILKYPLANKIVPWLTAVADTNNLFRDLDGVMLLTFLVNDDSGSAVRVAMDFTTNGTATKYHRLAIGAQLEALGFRIRDGVATWKEFPVETHTTDALYGQVSAAAEQWAGNKEGQKFIIKQIVLGQDRDGNSDIEAITIKGDAYTYASLGKLFITINA